MGVRRMRYFRLMLTVVLAGVAGIAMAQEVSPLTQIMELNRAGKWEQASQSAQRFLEANTEKPPDERCEAYYHLIYAQNRLGQTAQAQRNLATYEQKCQSVMPGHWLSVEVAKLREELAPRKVAPPVRNDGFWQMHKPATLGVNVSALENHRRLCERTGADACLVIRRGKIVQEIYSARYRVPMMAMSSTKSITGILVGMLIDDGKIKSIDESVCTYISEWCKGAKSKVTLRHLLMMTSGLPRMYEEGLASTNDKNEFVIKLPLASEPGTKWAYSNEGVQLLSPILDKAAGEPIQDYARKRLFEPLGMRETRLHVNNQQHAWTYADMETSARDFARIGLLMLNKGVWQGRRIVSKRWVEQSTERSQNLNPGYGLLWWLYENPAGFGAQGYLDTNLYVFPRQELIIVRMQSKPIERQTSYENEALSLFNQFVQQ
jgi:CubicO group peptidase (beta-lactamase class C family)